jgi:hypothetical protein
MKAKIQKMIFLVLAMALLFVIYRWAMSMKDSGSPYIRFPDKIDTFK